MPRRKPPAQMYFVFVTSYANEGVRAAVVAGQEFITSPEQLTTALIYSGTSKYQAEHSFSRAAIAAMNNPLAFLVVMERDSEVLARVRVERR